jgi:pilus assembly protein Flp/PilA
MPVTVIRIAPMLKRFIKNASGATAIEYGLIVAVLCLAIVGAISQSMNAIKNNFDYSAGIMENAIKE